MTKLLKGPDFLVIGAMKSGTTTLAYDLEQHANIGFPGGKEVMLLASDDFDDERDLIRAYFEVLGPSEGSLIGDASPRYLMNDTKIVADRASRLLCPDLKLICVLRDPIQRAISHYKHLWQWTTRSFGSIDKALEDVLFVETSMYGKQIAPWVEKFSMDRLLVFRFEDYIANRRKFISRMYTHLGVENTATSVDVESVLNAAKERYVRSNASVALRKILRRMGMRRPIPDGLKKLFLPFVARKAPPITDTPSQSTLDRLRELFETDIELLQQKTGNSDLTWDLDASIQKVLSQRNR